MSELDLDAISHLRFRLHKHITAEEREATDCHCFEQLDALIDELRRLREENAVSKRHGILDVMRERDEARAEAFRANRRADEFMAELRAIAAHVKCAQRVDAVTGAFDALAKRVEELEDVLGGWGFILIESDASGVIPWAEAEAETRRALAITARSIAERRAGRANG